MKNDGRLASTRPGMLTPSSKHKAIFRLQGHPQKAHVVLPSLSGPRARTAPMMDAVLTQISAAAWTRLVTGIPSGVTTYNSMLCSSTWANCAGTGIERANERGGLPGPKRAPSLFTQVGCLRFLLEKLDVIANLMVRREGNGGSGVFLETFGDPFQVSMFSNGGHGELGR